MSEYVTFKIAKKLKEKGFKEKVNAYYGKHENIFDVHPPLNMNDADYRASAPTISQVLKWLRNEKGIHITICVCGDGWFYEVVHISSGKSLIEDYEDDMVQSYEEAAIAGIEYVINDLI